MLLAIKQKHLELFSYKCLKSWFLYILSTVVISNQFNIMAHKNIIICVQNSGMSLWIFEISYKKLGYIFKCTYLFTTSVYTSKAVSESLTYTPIRNKFINKNATFMHSLFFYILRVLVIIFQSYLNQFLFNSTFIRGTIS